MSTVRFERYPAFRHDSAENRLPDLRDVQSLRDVTAQLQTVGQECSEKPHIFVAMPFADEYTDRFHYGVVGGKCSGISL